VRVDQKPGPAIGTVLADQKVDDVEGSLGHDAALLF
jgi:hypothetical protein